MKCSYSEEIGAIKFTPAVFPVDTPPPILYFAASLNGAARRLAATKEKLQNPLDTNSNFG